MGKRIIFTGGSGKAGRHVIPSLIERGHEVINLDRNPFPGGAVQTLITDLTQSGEVFNALSQHFGFAGLESGDGPARVDAVVHFAAIPRILIRPDNVTFAENVTSTYNVIEAAMKLGIAKVIIASSETTYGVCFAEGDKDYHAFPLTEDYDVDPMDSYGLSKVVNEKTARAFAMRFSADIYALRIGNVVAPEDYAQFPAYLANPPMRKRNAWSYIDARDLGQIVHLCVEKDGLGFQVFNAVNDTITASEPTRDFLAKWAPKTPISGDLDGYQAPISNAKIRSMLGFREEHDWRNYVSEGRG
ncbi:NAD(P)-dependent oxidoreductase [Rhizobium sp. SSA_523]|uniref:NAD-dependent epimerase/dehydratase family protein n=1 Tax=Rhizobium sp. SSA_523 TaxID=2952477 RepID=UPI0020909D7D|nr:NAD(P)-dependent oxidoreductase [Rhizobium sp. SSA_523]MCO5730946.1 NAD(P)-dependent oxidoreductase [Rhizobium sp. SSA_523]WKC24243.1 NAD(P)-dependent oxidoreductase [Rhizobium sp. SSA_523]